jgi:hypothetical protein
MSVAQWKAPPHFALAFALAFLVCHPRRGSASVLALIVAFVVVSLFVIPEGDLLVLLRVLAVACFAVILSVANLRIPRTAGTFSPMHRATSFAPQTTEADTKRPPKLDSPPPPKKPRPF